MESAEEKTIGKYRIEIHYDTNAESPQEDDDGYIDNFLLFDHRDFYVEKKGFDPTEIFDNGEKLKGYHVFRCYAYIHGGVALSVGSHNFPDARWDVSFKGFWLVKRQKGTWTTEQALKSAESLCSTWNQYLSGDVYGYKIFEGEEEVDSCWGYYGLDYCMEEAESIVNYKIENNG